MRIDRAIRRAVLVALAAPSAVACGASDSNLGGSANLTENESGVPDASDGVQEAAADGMAIDATGSPLDASVPESGDPESAFVDANWSACAPGPLAGIASNVCGAAYYTAFSLVGDASYCNITSGVITPAPSQCGVLCPPLADAAADAADVSSCLVEGAPLILNDAGTMVLEGTSPYSASVSCMYPVQPDCHGFAGRRTEGLLDESVEGPDACARILARIAYLEAASVGAFRRLEHELEAHDAPARLRKDARRAASDEVRHARVLSRHAARAGARVPSPRVEPGRVRSLEAIAVENVVEGCVRETYGAAVAALQSKRAGDVRLRRSMVRVADDEMRHSALAWQVAGWIDRHLDAGARDSVRKAARAAIGELRRQSTQQGDDAASARLGLPTARQSSALLDALDSTLWVSFRAAPETRSRRLG